MARKENYEPTPFKPVVDLGTILVDLLNTKQNGNNSSASTASSGSLKTGNQSQKSSSELSDDNPTKALNSVIIAAIAPLVAQHAAEAYMQTGQIPDASALVPPQEQSEVAPQNSQTASAPRNINQNELLKQAGVNQGLLSTLLGRNLNPEYTDAQLKNISDAQKITGQEPLQPKDKAKQDALDPMKSIEAMTKLNSIIEEKLPGYQTTQTADGSIVIHPKPSGVLAQMSPEQMDMMATNLVSGNVVPSQLPRIQKNQVLSAAMAKDPYYNPAKADIDFAVNKVGASNFEKLYNNVTSFEKTFRKNADVALKLSEGFDRSKIPLLNKAIMAGKLHIEGDPQASKLLVSLYTVATEYARLTSAPGATGSMITDSAREEARSMLNHYMNKGTIKELLDPEIGIMSIDAQNRLDALNETKSEIQNKISGRKGNNTSAQKDDASILRRLNLDPNKYELVR